MSKKKRKKKDGKKGQDEKAPQTVVEPPKEEKAPLKQEAAPVTPPEPQETPKSEEAPPAFFGLNLAPPKAEAAPPVVEPKVEAEPQKAETAAEKPPRPRDLQMWVGVSHYDTIKSFVDEAERMGVSKRVGHPPQDAKIGEALLFLTHDEGKRIECPGCDGTGVKGCEVSLLLEARVVDETAKRGWRWGPALDEGGNQTIVVAKSGAEMKELRDSMYKDSKWQQRYRKVEGQQKCERCGGWGKYPDGKVFGFCRINAVELVLDTPEAVKEYREREEELKKVRKVEVTPVVGGEGVEEARGCGFRSIGGLYLVSGAEDAVEELTALAKGFGAEFTVRGPFVELKEPVPYPHHRFFGTKLVDRRDVFDE